MSNLPTELQLKFKFEVKRNKKTQERCNKFLGGQK